MIIDYHSDIDRARLYAVLDLDRGIWLDKLPLFYADDEAGIYRVFLTDANGRYYTDPADIYEMAREERRARLAIVLKPGYESEEHGLALLRERGELIGPRGKT